MKKLCLWLFLAAFMLGNVCFARVADEDRVAKREKSELKKEERKAKKEEKKAKKEKAPKEKKHKKEKVKKEKKQKVKKEKAPKVKKEKKSKSERRAERKATAKSERMSTAERKERKALSREEKAKRGEEKSRKRAERKARRERAASDNESERSKQKYVNVRKARKERGDKMDKWSTMHALQIDRDSAAGAQAFLYKSPAWPTFAQFFEGKKDLLNVTFNYKYAKDCYGASGSGSESDVTKLTFGEQSMKVEDVLIASRMIGLKKLVQQETLLAIANMGAADKYLTYLAKEVFALNGRVEQYGLNFELSRYIVQKNFAVGVELPLLYKRHHLKMFSGLSDNAIKPLNAANPPVPTIANGAFGLGNDVAAAGNPVSPNLFLRRYGADMARFMKDALAAKGISELGGSASGLGDIAIFANGQFNSVLFDKLVLGMRMQFPTGKKASTSRLWGPELGNGGFSEIAGYGSVLFSNSKYLNPHLLGQVSFSLPGHVDRRVPKRIKLNEETVGAAAPLRTANAINADLKTMFAFGDRVARVKTTDNTAIIAANNDIAAAFSDYDSTIKNFGDTVSKFKLNKGAEFKLRLGNMFERFIAVKGFMDIFYDFRGKLKDKATGINSDQYNVDSITANTTEIEHRIGFDYSYQYDLYTRLRLGARYTFAGQNVPKTFDCAATVNYTF